MVAYLLAAFPAAAFLLLYRAYPGRPFDERLLAAAVAWALLLVGLTEGLSLLNGLTRANLALSWGVLLLLLTAHLILNPARGPLPWPGLPRPRWPLLALLLAVLLPALVIALLSLPNTGDALSYHIARVDHWIQNQTVAYYPAQSTRENEFPPFAEFVILNFQLLGDTDALSGLVQWLAMAGSLVFVYSIALALGASERGGVLAVIFAGTLPIAVLEASSTQNDLVVTFWLLGFIARFLAWRRSQLAADLLFAAAALGLAVLTKGTAIIFALPFGLWLLFEAATQTRGRRLRALGLLIGAVGLVVLPNLPHSLRNIAVYGKPLGGPSAVGAAVTHFSPSGFTANVMRDLAMQFATPLDAINFRIVDHMGRIASAIGVDLNQEDSTFLGIGFSLNRFVTSEDIATSPLHTPIMIAAFAAALLAWRRSPPPVKAYVLCTVAGFLLAALLIKWQPWINRLLLPGFLIAAPAVGEILERFLSRPPRAVLSALLLLGALPFAYLKLSNPLLPPPFGRPAIWQIPRHSTMYENRPELESQYRMVGAYLETCGCDQVGVIRDNDLWTVPLFRLMASHMSSYRIENLNRPRPDIDPGPEGMLEVPPPDPPAPLGRFLPKAIVWMGAGGPRTLVFGAVAYLRSFETPELHVYLPERAP